MAKINSKIVWEIVIAPAIGGLVAGYAANKLGYDITAIEGMKQTMLSILPLEALLKTTVSSEKEKEYDEFSAEHPYYISTSIGIICAATTFIGSYAIEFLSNTDISQGFIASSGFGAGALYGAYLSIRGKLKS